MLTSHLQRTPLLNHLQTHLLSLNLQVSNLKLSLNLQISSLQNLQVSNLQNLHMQSNQ
jgi:hypothetical protein